MDLKALKMIHKFISLSNFIPPIMWGVVLSISLVFSSYDSSIFMFSSAIVLLLGLMKIVSGSLSLVW